MIIKHDSQSGHQRAVILKRLAHPHHHDIRDDALVGIQPLAKEMLGIPKLRNDFCGSEIAAEALMPRRTEPAPHGTPRLRRNTQGPAILFGNEDRLDRIAITRIEQPFDRSIRRFVTTDHGHRLDTSPGRQLFAKRPGQIGHLIKSGCTLLMNPAKQLRGPEALFSEFFAIPGQPLKVQIEKVDRH